MSKEYVVKKGETLWEISKKIYGTGELYHIIAKENKISNPDTIQNGQIIKIPDIEFYTEKEVLEEVEKCEEYKKEIDRLNKSLDVATEMINNKQEEIVRLNNIINKLEKWLIEHIDEYRDMEQDAMFEFGLVLDKLKTLKENNKNE